MSAAENKALFQRFVEAMNKGDQQVIAQVWSPDLVHHSRKGTLGLAEVAKTMGGFRRAFPDLTFHIENLVADDDYVSARMTATCTHKEDFAGITATGRKVTVSVIGQVRIADGKIVEHWNIMDELHFLNQLGLVSDELLNTILA